MGALFSRTKVVWVPENEKLTDKMATYKQWEAKTSFVGWKVCNDGIPLCKVIGNSNTVAELDLSFNGLGDLEMKQLGLAITKNATSSPGPQEEGKLQELGTFKKINLSNNHIHYQRDSDIKGGICAITKALLDKSVKKQNWSEFSLRELNLANNYLGPLGATEIAKVLKQNRYLTNVDLSWNNIGNEGMIAILQSLKPYHKKAKINIRNNMFDPQAPDSLEDGWKGLKKNLKKTLGPDNLDGDQKGGVILGWTETPLALVKA